jgi:hypothetical protein
MDNMEKQEMIYMFNEMKNNVNEKVKDLKTWITSANPY